MKKTLTAIIIGLLCFSMFPILAPRTEAETSKWIVKTPLPRPQALFGAAVANGRIFAIGGQYQSGGPTPAWSDSNYEYDSLVNSWSSKAAMPTKRTTLAAISVNNKIYAIGGAASTSGGAFSVNEEFDPISNSWTARAPMPTPRNWISAAAVNGKIYVIGGSDNSGGIFSMNEMYDPLTDTWTTKKPDPQARLACGIGVVNGKIYLIGGWVRPGAPPGEPTTLNEEYDPQTDTWTTKAPMPTARNGLAVAVMNNRIYAIGGATDFNPWTNNLNVVEEYDPSTDTWIAVQSMPTPRSLLGAAVAGNKIYAIGGWGSTGYLDTNEEFSIGALVGYWKFDEGSGSVAFDLSGNDYDGAVNGAEWINGVGNGALYFDGSDYVAVPDNPSLSGFTQLTLEAWIKPDRFDSYLKGIVNKGNGGGYFGDEYGLQLNYDKVRLILSAGSPTGWIVVADTDPIISLNQWYHVAGVWDSTNYYIYVNGQLAKSGQTIVSGASIHDTSNSLNIGGIAAGSWLFNGAIDEVKIYNFARTAEEIQNDYIENAESQVVTGIETVVHLNSYKTVFSRAFSIQQNLWIYGGSQEYWAQNIIMVWPFHTNIMTGLFEIYNKTAPSTNVRLLAYWESWGFGDSKETVAMRSAIDSGYLVMDNDYSSVRWQIPVDVLSNVHIESPPTPMFSSPEIVIVGPPSLEIPSIGLHLTGNVAFENPTYGSVDTYVKIGSHPGTWLYGINRVIGYDDQKSTAEYSQRMQWHDGGQFEYAGGFGDQGLWFGPDRERPSVTPPPVPTSSNPPRKSSPITIYLQCPVELSILDDTGNHIGYNSTSGLIDEQIPNSWYMNSSEAQAAVILDPQGDYGIATTGTAAGNYTLGIEYVTDTETTTQAFTGTISPQETKYYSAILSETGQMTAISWEYVFKDLKRGTMLKISTDDKYFQFTAPSKDFGVRHDPKMFVKYGIIVICYGDAEMRLTATAVDSDFFYFCTALAYDKQTRKTYVLIDKPYGPRCLRLYEQL